MSWEVTLVRYIGGAVVLSAGLLALAGLWWAVVWSYWRCSQETIWAASWLLYRRGKPLMAKRTLEAAIREDARRAEAHGADHRPGGA